MLFCVKILCRDNTVERKGDNMRVAICDDEEEFRQQIISGIKSYNPAFEIVEYTDGSGLVQAGEEYDLIFLDIEMPELDGMSTARQLRARNVDSEIVFFTSHEKYVFDSFDIRPLQFLKKPLEEERLVKILDTVEHALEAVEQIELALANGTCYIKVKDIVYVESCGEGLNIRDRLGTVYEVRRETIKKWMERLREKGFVRIHKSYMVSMFYVEVIGSSHIKLKGIETPLEVGRKYAKDFREQYLEFVRKNGRIV